MIFRTVKRDNPFVQVDKTGIYDNRLSWKAKGILVYLLSRKEDWDFYLKEIITHAKDGRDSVTSGIKELEEAGYIIRERKRGEDGKYGAYVYLVYEVPQKTAVEAKYNQSGKAETGLSDFGKPAPSNIESSNNEGSNSNILTASGKALSVEDRLLPYWNEICDLHGYVKAEKYERLTKAIRAWSRGRKLPTLQSELYTALGAAISAGLEPKQIGLPLLVSGLTRDTTEGLGEFLSARAAQLL